MADLGEFRRRSGGGRTRVGPTVLAGFGFGIASAVVLAVLLIAPFDKAGAAAGFLLPGLLMIYGAVQLIVVIVLCAIKPPFGGGYILGQVAVVVVPSLYLILASKWEAHRAYWDATAFASKELPVFTKAHSIIEIPSASYGGSLSEDHYGIVLRGPLIVQVKTTERRLDRAYRGGSGPECWDDANLAMTLKLMTGRYFGGGDTDVCIVAVPFDPLADAIVVIGKETPAAVLVDYRIDRVTAPKSVPYYAVIGERIAGTYRVVSRVAYRPYSPTGAPRLPSSPPAPYHLPVSPTCNGASNVDPFAVCVATGIQAYKTDELRKSPDPETALRIGLSHIGNISGDVQRLSSEMVVVALRRMSRTEQERVSKGLPASPGFGEKLFDAVMQLYRTGKSIPRQAAVEFVNVTPFSAQQHREFLEEAARATCAPIETQPFYNMGSLIYLTDLVKHANPKFSDDIRSCVNAALADPKSERQEDYRKFLRAILASGADK